MWDTVRAGELPSEVGPVVIAQELLRVQFDDSSSAVIGALKGIDARAFLWEPVKVDLLSV